jgi:hypothetical protein
MLKDWRTFKLFSGFGDSPRRMVSRRCLKWVKVVTKYKQIVVYTDEGPMTKKIPDEWGVRCLQWAPDLIGPPKRRGTLEPYEFKPLPEPRPRRFPKSHHIVGAEYKVPHTPQKGRKIYHEVGELPCCNLSGIKRPKKLRSLCRVGGKLKYGKRKALRRSIFGLPELRKYPMADVSHARVAKARANQQLRRGNLTRAQYSRIVRKANAIIKACKR